MDVPWPRERAGRVVVADVRWSLDGRSGRQAYEQGHLPGAVFVDPDFWLAGPPGPEACRHPLPAPELFAEGLARLGIGDTGTVVAYDAAGGVTAARLADPGDTLDGTSVVRGNLDKSGRTLPVEALRQRFATVGVTGSTPVVPYGGSGVPSCHSLLAREVAGPGPRLHPGAWSQYRSAPGHEVEVGAGTWQP